MSYIYFFLSIIWLKEYILLLFGHLCNHFDVVQCQEDVELVSFLLTWHARWVIYKIIRRGAARNCIKRSAALKADLTGDWMYHSSVTVYYFKQSELKSCIPLRKAFRVIHSSSLQWNKPSRFWWNSYFSCWSSQTTHQQLSSLAASVSS